MTIKIGRLYYVAGLLWLILVLSIGAALGGVKVINRDRYVCLQSADYLLDTTMGIMRHHGVSLPGDMNDSGNFRLDQITTGSLEAPDKHRTAAIENDHLLIADQAGRVVEQMPVSHGDALLSWSPQGDYLALIRAEDRYYFDVVNLKTLAVYSASADLINDTPPELAQWSSDGHSWLFVQQLGARYWEDARTVMKLDADTGIVSALSDNDLSRSVILSPKGRYVAVVRQIPEGDQIVEVIDTDTGSGKMLVNPVPSGTKMQGNNIDSNVYLDPHWTPDGQYVTVAWAV